MEIDPAIGHASQFFDAEDFTVIYSLRVSCVLCEISADNSLVTSFSVLVTIIECFGCPR